MIELTWDDGTFMALDLKMLGLTEIKTNDLTNYNDNEKYIQEQCLAQMMSLA